MRSIYARSFTKAFAVSAAALIIFGYSAIAQSTLQDHPTPLVRNEIEATVKARDVGDSRLTTHYYWFDGGQGDVFINWTSKNFAGDVDLFIQNGLRPLSKIVVYADFGEVETGRVIYLRKPERLLVRVQGRTPNDEAATYRLKFAGSFVAATASEKDVPMLPSVGESPTGAVRVNSVGTILPPPPKPVDPKAATAAVTKEASSETSEQAKSEPEKAVEERKADLEEKKDPPKLEVVVDDPVKKIETPAASTRTRPPRRNRNSRDTPAKKTEGKTAEDQPAAKATDKDTAATTLTDRNQADAKIEGERSESVPEKPKSSEKADPLANVNLVIMFKDGSKIERPLPEVFRFSVDRGVLTVISKDGRVGKYQMIDVSKVTIE